MQSIKVVLRNTLQRVKPQEQEYKSSRHSLKPIDPLSPTLFNIVLENTLKMIMMKLEQECNVLDKRHQILAWRCDIFEEGQQQIVQQVCSDEAERTAFKNENPGTETK